MEFGFDLRLLYFLVPLIIASTVPLAIVALGALYSERSGVVNIALEGIMLMGAYVGAVTLKQLEKTSEAFPVLNAFVSLLFALFITHLLYLFTLFLIKKYKGDVNLTKQVTIILYTVYTLVVTVLVFLMINSVDIYIQYALIALIIGAVVGIVFSLLHAYAAVNMKSNQIISATALNMFAPAFAIFVNRTFSDTQTKQVTVKGDYLIDSVPVLGDIPFIGDLFFQNAYLSTYIGILIFIVAVVILFRTKFGLRLRSCGENPHAADSLGINIYKIRYTGVMVSGALAGMGGVVFMLSFAPKFGAEVAGFGFLALAVLIFGNWKPSRIIVAAIFFAFMRVVSNSYGVIPVIRDWEINSEIYKMLPYVATLIVLAFVSKNSAAPLAAGEPYDPGKR
jgi:simple sugar transport system permease protein